MESQRILMENMLEKQEKQHRELFKDEMEKQRAWEKEQADKERDFQREQNSLMMQTLKEMQARTQMPLYSQGSFMPLRVVPVNIHEKFLNSSIIIYQSKIFFYRLRQRLQRLQVMQRKLETSLWSKNTFNLFYTFQENQ